MTRVEVYSKDGCPYCTKAKELLKRHNMTFTEHKVGSPGVTKQVIQERAGTEIRTVPQIFINDSHIGGYDDLVKYLKTN